VSRLPQTGESVAEGVGVKFVGEASDLRYQCQDVQCLDLPTTVAIMTEAHKGAIWRCTALTNSGRSARLEITTEMGKLGVELPLRMLRVSYMHTLYRHIIWCMPASVRLSDRIVLEPLKPHFCMHLCGG
jgi:hypothetical protein